MDGWPTPWRSLLLVLVLGLVACDDSITPISGDVDGNFTLTGYLDTDADTQFVRVTPARFQFKWVDATPLDARVFTRNLSTGEETVWQDSLIRLTNGDLDHLFFTTAPVEPGVTYEFIVAPPNEPPTSARILIPSSDSVNPGDINVRPTVIEKVFVQDVDLVNINEAPDALDLIYRYIDPNTRQPDTLTITYTAQATQEGAWQGELIGRTWTFPVRLTDDRYTLLSHLEIPSDDSTVVLVDITAEVVRLSPTWRVPIPRSIVVNGYGFIGARTRYEHTWQIDPERLRELGFNKDAVQNGGS
ncbi:MAG: hypothetical protein RhofKO_14010 [Rhodothermales bacterium]